MLLILLIQATRTITVSEGILPAVYGTLVAAVLSLAASIYATVISSKTAEKVANLSRQAAQELKDRDYKNDFYKKILDKRFVAWAEAEELIKLLVNTLVDENDVVIPSYFASPQAFDKVMDKIRSMVAQTFWMGKEYADHLTTFYDTLQGIREGCTSKDGEKNSDGMPAVNGLLLIQAGRKYNMTCNRLLDGLLKILGRQVVSLHDIEGFFKQFEHLGTKMQ